MNQIDDAEILQRIRAVLRERLGDDITTLDADTGLAQALGERYDSLAAMECITAIEEAFDVEVDFVAHDVRHSFSTLARMTEFVRAQLEDRALLRSGG